ncbi:hypothetical protein [Saccharothrix variisporea]|uniref:Uncharacterized protein n=1 Tax=Saccharothrix variisporea TaxID=543527 RepID=A0A495XTM2_9PSEU|nr:hypothetical protein [Saccharothrix variisporea]RKT75038.1 hypothetical protein DFJ66_8415 [Saccharothrix variisporea]
MKSTFLLRLAGLLGAALVAGAVTAAPAQATLGPAQPIDIQLRGYSSTGIETQVGRMVGTIRFDDGNTLYRIDATMYRQSSYVDTKLRIEVNGATHQNFYQSGTISADFPYPGVVQNVRLVFEGLYYDGATNRVKTITRSAFYDNPYN